jgi:predicted RNA-binding protein with EMAP domain|tara:strand:- start:1089 stop:1319 length:231 start_codon:yes stop_codon:yes gene_type:complete
MSYQETQKDRDFNRVTELMGDYLDSQKTVKSLRKDLKEIRDAVKGILDWSQRIGSDEIHELNEIVRFINRSAIKNK